MSYDYPDGYVPPPQPPKTWRGRIYDIYLDGIIWLALDAPRPLNRIGLWALYRIGRKR